MLVGKLAVLFSCRGVLLGLFMLADRVMVLRLMMVMRGRMMVSSCVVMVLARWMFRCLCHLDALCMRRLGYECRNRKSHQDNGCPACPVPASPSRTRTGPGFNPSGGGMGPGRAPVAGCAARGGIKVRACEEKRSGG